MLDEALKELDIAKIMLGLTKGCPGYEAHYSARVGFWIVAVDFEKNARTGSI